MRYASDELKVFVSLLPAPAAEERILLISILDFPLLRFRVQSLKAQAPNPNVGVISGLYRNNGKENGDDYLGFRVSSVGFRVSNNVGIMQWLCTGMV